MGLLPCITISRTVVAAKFFIPFAAVRSGKRGLISLALATKPFTVDLTVYIWTFRLIQDQNFFTICIAYLRVNHYLTTK
jgi:hypothetical protein